MSDQAEFLELCRLAASPGSGGQYTDEKLNAIEQVESDARGVVSRLLAILDATANYKPQVRRRLEDGYWMMQRGDTRVMAEVGAPYIDDANGVTLRITHNAMGVSTELDAESADALASWLNQWRRLRGKPTGA